MAGKITDRAFAEWVGPSRDLRLLLVDAKSILRAAQDELRRDTLALSARLVAEAGGERALGPTEKSRERTLSALVAADASHQLAQKRLREAEARVERIEANLENQLEARRAFEWHVRDLLADALAAYAERPCIGGIEHASLDSIVDATGRRGVFAGESSYIEEQRIGE